MLRSRAEIEINPEVLASLRFSGERMQDGDDDTAAHGHP